MYKRQLLACDKFQISVAFITMGGITPLLQTLKELEKNGIPGEILLWNSRYALSFDNFYEEYKERYQIIKRQREIAKSEETPSRP